MVNRNSSNGSQETELLTKPLLLLLKQKLLLMLVMMMMMMIMVMWVLALLNGMEEIGVSVILNNMEMVVTAVGVDGGGGGGSRIREGKLETAVRFGH